MRRQIGQILPGKRGILEEIRERLQKGEILRPSKKDNDEHVQLGREASIESKEGQTDALMGRLKPLRSERIPTISERLDTWYPGKRIADFIAPAEEETVEVKREKEVRSQKEREEKEREGKGREEKERERRRR